MEVTYQDKGSIQKLTSGMKLLITIPAILWMKGMPFRFFVAFVTANMVIPLAVPLIEFFEQYVYSDFKFGVVIGILLFFESLAGWVKHWKIKTFDRKEAMWGLAKNALIIIGFSYIFHALRFSLIESGTAPEEFMTTYLRLLKQLCLIAYFSLSMSVSFFTISNGRFPPAFFMRRLRKFKDTGDIEELLKAEAERIYRERDSKDRKKSDG